MVKKIKILRTIGRAFRSVGWRPTMVLGSKYLLRMAQPIVGDLIIQVEGFRLSGSLWHRRELWKLQEGAYEPFTTQLFKDTIKYGIVICDIGAHIGYFSLLAAQCAGPKGKVYAFEPDPRNFAHLVHNINDNGFSEVIIPIDKAISNRTGDIVLYLDGLNPGGNSLFSRATSTLKRIVQSVTLDEFLYDCKRIDVIKLDIEGGELLALAGMVRLLTRNRSVRMFVECNASMLHAAGTTVKELIDRLNALGFTIKVIHEEEQQLEKVNESVIYIMENSDQHFNLFCSREGDSN